MRDYDKGYWFELGYLPGNYTVLVLYGHNKNGKQVNLNYYQKVLKNTDSDMGQGITFITNKTLISGTYYSVYPVTQNAPIIFKNNGDVYGLKLEGIKTYHISTDFEAGPANNLDQLTFNLYTKEQKDYLFKFAGDTLKVFDTAFSPDSSRLRWGELRYKLVRKP